MLKDAQGASGVQEFCRKHGISDATPCSKEVPVIEVDVSRGGTQVCRILDRLFVTCPLPDPLILDNGPAFAGTALNVNFG